MSEATRSVALAEAAKLFTTVGEVLTAAAEFNAFLESGQAPKVQSHSAPTAPAKTVAAEKPKKDTAVKAAAKTETQLNEEAKARVKATDEAAAQTTTKQHVANAVEALLKASKREEAKKLLAKFGANSVSSVPEEDYEAFVAEANGILAEQDLAA